MTLLGVAAFNRELERFATKLVPSAAVLVQKKMAFQALAGLVNTTPVDTGRARGNWQVSINEPVDGDIDEVVNPSQAISEGNAVINSIPQFGPFVAIYLTNNVPYIRRLNDGHSDQAPKMFVEKVFETLRTQFA